MKDHYYLTSFLLLTIVSYAFADVTHIKNSDHHSKLVSRSGKSGVIYYAPTPLEFDLYKPLLNELHNRHADHDPHFYVGILTCSTMNENVCSDDVSGALVAYQRGTMIDLFTTMNFEVASDWLESLNLSTRCLINDIKGTCSDFAAQFINSKWKNVRNRDVLQKEMDRLTDMLNSDRVQAMPKHKQALFAERIDILTQLSISLENEDEF